MFRYRIVAWAAVAAIFVGAGQATAGWVIDQAVKGDAEGGRMQMLLQANRMKHLVLGPDGKPMMAFIMDLNAETITQVDYQARRYTTATIQEYSQMMRGMQQAASGHMAQAMQQMQEALKDMPPEQRQMMEQMMRSQGPQAAPTAQECREPRIEMRRTGQQATIAGYPAVRFDVYSDGKQDSEVWIAKGITAWREVDPQKMERFANEMAKAVGCGQQRAGVPGSDASWKLAGEGYPVRTVSRGGGGGTMEVVKAESRSIPAAEFQPPAGFARKTLREMMGM